MALPEEQEFKGLQARLALRALEVRKVLLVFRVHRVQLEEPAPKGPLVR